jgi:uncharacterized protein YdaU (DUF1376 family)
MKTYVLFTLAVLCCLNIHCRNSHVNNRPSNISFTIEETDDDYRIFANYDPEKTKAVESVLDDYLKQDNDPSFTNTRIDADITMNDKTTFHIKHLAGDLEIELDKDKNSPTTLHRFKEMAERIKKAM